MSLLDASLLDPVPVNVHIAWWTDRVYGTGTLADPWHGSTAARLDEVLVGLTANTAVHFGPGLFDANGFHYEATSGAQKVRSNHLNISSSEPFNTTNCRSSTPGAALRWA